MRGRAAEGRPERGWGEAVGFGARLCSRRPPSGLVSCEEEAFRLSEQAQRALAFCHPPVSEAGLLLRSQRKRLLLLNLDLRIEMIELLLR